MKRRSLLSLVATVSICSILLGFSPNSRAATATNLVTICTSAKAQTQAGNCTAWQYNVYSPTAYIESYPTVNPAESGIHDPNYDFRLGSTLTPTMGVKVCPTALTPGVSYTNPQADPCPNNVLISASTVLPANPNPDTYAVVTEPTGMVVYQVNANTSAATVVPGSPFVPSPVPKNISGTESFPSPTLTTLDPAGQYLYAVYDPGYYVSEVVYSYKMVNGVPTQVSSFSNLTGGDNAGSIGMMVATAQHIYLFSLCAQAPPCGAILTVNNGVFASNYILFSEPLNSSGQEEGVINIAVDPQEHFLYMYLSPAAGQAPDNVAIFSLNFAASSANLVQVLPLAGPAVLGAQ